MRDEEYWRPLNKTVRTIPSETGYDYMGKKNATTERKVRPAAGRRPPSSPSALSSPLTLVLEDQPDGITVPRCCRQGT